MIRSERIPIEDLVVDPVQARGEPWTNDETDRQLAASVAEEGLLQDLIVRPIEHVTDGMDLGGNSDTSYAIVAGSRRYHAAMDAGLETVPCKVLEADDLDAAWTSLLENTDRKDLSEQEIAQQLALIYEFVRPRQEPAACPQCSEPVADGPALDAHYDQADCTPRGDDDSGNFQSNAAAGNAPTRFSTDRQAKRYLAQRFLGRTDDSAIALIEGHLRTAALPDSLQALFKTPDDRTTTERQTLENYGIETDTTLGSGEGKSGTSREIVALHDTVETDLADDAVDGTDAVLETVGSLTHPEMSEQELRRTLRDFRHDVTAAVEADASADTQQQQFTDTLRACANEVRETYDEVEPQRPFKKVDVLGPDTQRHSRWHAHAKQTREVSGHGELVRELYQERLEALAEQEGWE